MFGCEYTGVISIVDRSCAFSFPKFVAIYFQSEDAAQRSEALGNSVVDFVPTEVEKVNDDDDDDDTKSIANSVMSESSIKSIHSKKSLTELISKARGRMMVMATIEEEGEDAILPPVVSTVTDDNGARMAEKKSIHKLAFKNRNPSV